MNLEELLTRPEGKTEEPMPEVNAEAIDFRVASGLFSGLRDWNEHTSETLPAKGAK